jgi:hypothetical protein
MSNVSTASATIVGKPASQPRGTARRRHGGGAYVDAKEVKVMKIVVRTVESVKSTQLPDS